ncbi:MAG TPA: TVP38/TMEM64 family protein [Pirellulales bacterium]|nr:TVP38/TMEM64 family protein [Pirellulales bacterium]
MKITAKLRIAVIAFLGAALGAAFVWLPVKQYLEALLQAVRATGPWGPALLAAAYVLTTVLLVPGSIITLGAGFLFGVPIGTVAVSVGSVAGACAAFWIGRTVARGWIQKKTAQNPRFHALDEAIGREGFKIVLLIRLSPVFPFVFTNYALALTSVRFRDFLLASWIGMLPGTVLYVYLGSTLKSLAELASGGQRRGAAQNVLFGLGLLATFLATIVITRSARAALRQAAPLAEE